MAVDSATQRAQTKAVSDAEKHSGPIRTWIDTKKKEVQEAAMDAVKKKLGIPTEEEMKADMMKDMPAMPGADKPNGESDEKLKAEPLATEKLESESLSADTLEQESLSADTLDQPSTDGADAVGTPSTDGADSHGNPALGDLINKPSTDKADAIGTPRINEPTLNEPTATKPTDSDVRPDAIATPRQDEPKLDEPDQKEPEKPKEMSNPTLKEKPSKNDPKLKPQMELPTEEDLK